MTSVFAQLDSESEELLKCGVEAILGSAGIGHFDGIISHMAVRIVKAAVGMLMPVSNAAD